MCKDSRCCAVLKANELDAPAAVSGERSIQSIISEFAVRTIAKITMRTATSLGGSVPSQ
jgi:hypothetical protein